VPQPTAPPGVPPGGAGIAIIPDVVKYTPSKIALYPRRLEFGSDLFNRSTDLFLIYLMSLIKTKINQKNAQINSGLIYY